MKAFKINSRVKVYVLLTQFLLLLSLSYSQSDSTNRVITRYSLNPTLVKSWQADSNGCRKYLVGLDTIKTIKGASISDFITLLGKPDLATNEYGESTNIKDTILCTYRTFTNCNTSKNKSIPDFEFIVLFINDKLISIERIIIN